MYQVPDTAPIEDRAICDLVNQGLDPRQLFRAAYSFRRQQLEEQCSREGRLVVETGLFEGMHLYPKSLASQLMPKVQGTYEKEVQDYIFGNKMRFDRFLDVGCAEGFYLSGIARWKRVPCFGVDIDPTSESAVDFVAKKNGVQDMISFSKRIESISSFLIGSPLCLVDVDGAEFEVLRALNQLLDSVATLRAVLLIVETDCAVSGGQNTFELIASLVGSGWRVETIISQDPRNRFVNSNFQLSFLDQVAIGAEGRYAEQCWIVARKIFAHKKM